jgi:outer membrane protein assembly factor BamB
VWSFQTGGPIYSSAAVSDGLIYIGSDDGTIYAFGLPPGTDH